MSALEVDIHVVVDIVLCIVTICDSLVICWPLCPGPFSRYMYIHVFVRIFATLKEGSIVYWVELVYMILMIYQF